MPVRRRRVRVRRGRRRAMFRRSRRRTAGGRRRGGIRWKKNGFPNAVYVTMAYVANISVDPSTGSSNWYTFRCNSIYDPDKSGIGHQPFGHDQWEQIYNRYHVLKSVITVQAIPNLAPPSNPLNLVSGTGTQSAEYTPNYSGVLFIKMDDDDTITSTPEALMEGQMCRYKPFSSINGWSPKLSYVYNNRRMQREQVHVTSAPFGSNPSDQQYFHVGAMSVGGANNMCACQLIVRLKYYVKLYDRKDIAQST